MNENFDPTLEIGISDEGLSEEDTASAVENIQAADIKLGREITKPLEQTKEEVQEEIAIEANKPEEYNESSS